MSSLPIIRAFDIDVFPLYRAVNLCVRKSKYTTPYDCEHCAKEAIEPKDVVRHVFSGHNDKIRILRRLVFKSNDSSRYICICGFTVLSFYIETFILHFIGCLGFKKQPEAVKVELAAFRSSSVYALCQEAIQLCTAATTSADERTKREEAEDIDEQMPFHFEDPPLSRSEIISSIKEQLAHPVVDTNQLTKVFGANLVDTTANVVSHKHRLRINLRNLASNYLHSHALIDDDIECKHCGISVNSLLYIQHAIREHVNYESYGAAALPCPNCLTYVSRMIYATGYHYATMICHIVECILNSLDLDNDENYDTFVTEFNQICLSAATHSPYVVNKLNPGYEHDSDNYFSLEELVNSSRPDETDSTTLGDSVVRNIFKLGKADLHQEFSTFLRINCDKPVAHFNGECKICLDDMRDMLDRMRHDAPGLSTEYLLTTEQFRARFPGTLPRFISDRETPLVEPLQGISGLKLFMLEVAARLPHCQLHSIPEVDRGKYLYATHTYVYKGKAASIFNWLERNSHRVFVFPNSTLCWDWCKFDREFDPMDLTNTHRHLIIVYDTYATYREFSTQQFNFDPPFQAAASQMIRTGRARQHRVQIVGKVSKVITSPQHLFGVTIYVSRFKIPNNPRFRLQRQQNPGNDLVEAENYDENYHYEGALNLLDEYDYHQANIHRDVDDDTIHNEAKTLKHCYNSSTSDHHEMTCPMSRHSKIISYALYKDGLTDWYDRARIYNEILWLHQATNLKTFDYPPLERSDTIDWPDRSDLSSTYIKLNTAKSVLPGYISNHPVGIISDQLEFKESRDRLRSFGGVLFDSSPLFIYREHEFCYIRLSLNCSKRLVNYIQTVSTRINEYSGMVMFNNTASKTIYEMKKMIDQYKILVDDYERRESDSYVKRIQYFTYIVNLNFTIDNILTSLIKVLNGKYSSKEKQLQAFITVTKRLLSYNNQVNRLSDDQIDHVTRDLLVQARQLYEAVNVARESESEVELVARHLQDRLRVLEDRK